MASSSTKSLLSIDEYESDFWRVWKLEKCFWRIVIERIPTSSSNFVKWDMLMKEIAILTELDLLGAMEVVDFRERRVFTERCIPPFCEALKNNTIITTLGVSWNAVTANGMTSICKVLQTHRSIICMNFVSEEFSRSFGRDLEAIIATNNTLKTLSVSIKAEEAKFVARALPHNVTLTELNVGSSYMGNEGLRILCDGLKGNYSITRIDLSWNDISDEGIEKLCSLLEINHSITSVDLQWNNITTLPLDFAFLSHIKTLNLYGNNMLFPPEHVTYVQSSCFEFFANFRYGPMKFHFLLGFHERVGNHTSIQSYLYRSSIFEPNLLGCIFEFLP